MQAESTFQVWSSTHWPHSNRLWPCSNFGENHPTSTFRRSCGGVRRQAKDIGQGWQRKAPGACRTGQGCLCWRVGRSQGKTHKDSRWCSEHHCNQTSHGITWLLQTVLQSDKSWHHMATPNSDAIRQVMASHGYSKQCCNQTSHGITWLPQTVLQSDKSWHHMATPNSAAIRQVMASHGYSKQCCNQTSHGIIWLLQTVLQSDKSWHHMATPNSAAIRQVMHTISKQLQ